MAGDSDDSQKTEEPTQRRLDDAREQGDVVRSSEVSTFFLLGGATLVIALFGKSLAEGFAHYFTIFLEQPDQIPVDPGAMQVLMSGILLHLLPILAPVFGLMIVAALGGHLIQHRPIFSASKLKPDFGKLSLLKGLKRMFGLDGWSNMLKGLVKIAIVGMAVWTQLWPMRTQIESVLTEAPADVMGDMIHVVIRIMIAALAALAVIAGLDYFLQRYRFLQRNRMSRHEIKEEFRQSDGDPAIKAKIRQIRMERSRKRMMAAVPEATVIITNPTHFAVALKYESGKMAAPVCVAKGADALALRIRELAREHDVPIVENPPLARALYATVEVDEAVPPEHFKAVAQVIGYVMRLSGQLRN
ncbi:MAG TPA: flagellar biosynthesis protein FlhB [Rhizomicrobium sp.]|jgi:flagellar biosynthetic protein FlhB|nr:flagellar biosynthesis protein FlhB [Rhizomicrobium sp.]